MPETNNGFLPRREVELLIEAGQALMDERLKNHRLVHVSQREAVEAALEAVHEQDIEHRLAHEKAHEAHEQVHSAAQKSVEVALDAVGRERAIHAEAHEREHVGHLGVHSLNNLAIEKAEQANDKRFQSTNAYREQINDMVRSLAPREALEVLTKDVDRRFEESRKDRERRHEELRQAIASLERTDVKAEGKGLGQGVVLAYIGGAVGFVATMLTIIIVLANVVTGSPP